VYSNAAVKEGVCCKMCLILCAVRELILAKYLGVLLCAGKSFSVDLIHAKSKFYDSFNSLFHHVARYQSELVVLRVLSAFCRPHLLYGTECLNLNISQLRSLEHTWYCAMSHIFRITGTDVKLICNYTAKSFDEILSSKKD